MKRRHRDCDDATQARIQKAAAQARVELIHGIAEADGSRFATRLSEKAEVKQVLKQFVDFPGPAFLEVMVDQDACVYPMVGPGMGYKEMVTGDFIKSRPVSVPHPDAEVDMTKVPDLF